VGQTIVVADEAREARQGFVDCSTVDGNAVLGFHKPSASIASRSSGCLSSDWPRDDGVWLLQWLRRNKETNRCSGGEMISRNTNEAGMGADVKNIETRGYMTKMSGGSVGRSFDRGVANAACF
jgi:hypothetical protein